MQSFREMQKRRSRKNNIATISEDLAREEVSFSGRGNKVATAGRLGRKFSLASARSMPQSSLPGCYKLVTSQGYEEFLRAVGCGPLSLNMVMRSASFIEIGRVRVTMQTDNDMTILVSDAG